MANTNISPAMRDLAFSPTAPGGSVKTFIHPDADSLDGNWLNESGSNVNLFSSIDEGDFDDADYIHSGDNPSADVCKIRLGDFPGPVNQPFEITYRYKRSSSQLLGLTVRLVEGTTVRATWVDSDIGEFFETITQTLTSGEFNSIVDFNNLFIEFQADPGTFSGLNINISPNQGNIFTSRTSPDVNGNAIEGIYIRTLNNYGSVNNNTLSSSFVIFGHPFTKGQVPTGSIVTGGIVSGPSNGSSVLIQDLECNSAGTSSTPLLENDGSLRQGAMMVANITGIDIPAGGSAQLQMTSGTGTWVTTNSRTNTDWINRIDTVEITGLATTGTSAADMNGAGTWTASFNTAASPNVVDIIGSSPLCYAVRVRAPFKNGATTHRFLWAWMYYAVMQLSNGSLGPVASLGPFIDNTMALETNPSRFDYTVAWKRNGVVQRTYAIQHTSMTFAKLPRPDGRWDWSTNDPTIWISQDYTKTRKTRKVLPYQDGIVYTGRTDLMQATPSITSITSNVFTTTGIFSLTGEQLHSVSVSFTATGIPTGLTAGTVYWFRYVSSSTFTIYDTKAHAEVGGTGQITGIGAYSGGMSVYLVVAPMTPGALSQYMPATGEHIDLSPFGEWGSAYHVANTKAFQDLARVHAYAMAGVPDLLTDKTTGKIISFLTTGGTYPTPSGMVSKTSTYWRGGGAYSSDIGGGAGPTGGYNFWTSDAEHFPNGTIYPVWVMEGNPFLRDLQMYIGCRSAAGQSNGPTRNFGLGGTTYYGVSFFSTSSPRANAWNLLGNVYAAYMARQGSAEQTYFNTQLLNNCAQYIAYINFKDNGTNTYSKLGVSLVNEQQDNTATESDILDYAAIRGFMQSYFGCTTAFAAMLMGDVVSGLNTVADFSSQWIVGLYASPRCGYFATTYTLDCRISNGGVATPGLYHGMDLVAITQDDPQMTFNYTSGSTTITWVGVKDTMPTPAVGDRFIPHNYTNGALQVPPSIFTSGTAYWVKTVNAGAKQFTASATSGGSAIQSNQTVTGSGGCFVPSGQSCPSTGTFLGSTISGGQDDLAKQRAAMALQSVRVSPPAGVAATYDLINARFTGNGNTNAMWYLQRTL